MYQMMWALAHENICHISVSLQDATKRWCCCCCSRQIVEFFILLQFNPIQPNATRMSTLVVKNPLWLPQNVTHHSVWLSCWHKWQATCLCVNSQRALAVASKLVQRWETGSKMGWGREERQRWGKE